MVNARTIINQATRKINVSGVGQTLSAEESQAALEALNGILSTFSAESGTIYSNEIENFTLSGGASYTIGVGGDLNTSRPVLIKAASVRIGSIDYPLALKNLEQYAEISYKDLTGIPEILVYIDNVPLGTIKLFPAAVAGYVLTLYTLKALTSFANLTTDYNLPPGAENMMVWNLARVLCPEYEKPVPPLVAQQSKVTKTALETYIRKNDYPISVLDNAEDFRGTNNIFSGWRT